MVPEWQCFGPPNDNPDLSYISKVRSKSRLKPGVRYLLLELIGRKPFPVVHMAPMHR